MHEETALVLLFDPFDGTVDSPEYPTGIFREMGVGGFPAWAGVEALLRIIQSSIAPTDASL